MANGSLNIALVGINHKSCSVEEREVFQPGRKEVPEYLNKIFGYDEVDGILIISTCNRLEFYMVIQPGFNPFEIIKRIYKEKNIDFTKYEHIFYTYEEKQVTRHLFKVISGLDSLVLGEYQIQGQVKEGYSIACEVKTVDKILHKLFHAAFRTGKKVRRDTSLGEGRQSVSGMAAQIMIDHLKNTDTICIIGVNENTRIMAEKLTYAGFRNFIFVNRTKFKAEMLAEQFGGKASSIEKLEKALSKSQAVYTSTGAPGYIITSEMLKNLYENEQCPKLMVDMALPRDIDTRELPGDIKTYDIDDLQKYLDEQKKNQLHSVPDAEKIIEDEVSVFQAWSEMRTNSIIEPYSEKFEIIRQQIMEEYKQQFSEMAYERAEKLSKSLVHRMQSTFVQALIRTNQELKVFLQHRDSM
ncbi:glutamyl-tRNA reductase [Bacteroidota bacterium]